VRPEESWTEFCARRDDYLIQLAEPIERAVVRRDTWHPVFSGCIDWHSSVHGIYSLLAIGRLTGVTRYAEVVDTQLRPKGISDEIDDLISGAIDEETPYGFSWLLHLACEREQHGGKRDLRILASEAASRLTTWVLSLSELELDYSVHSRDYKNISWALLNLWEWSQHVSDNALQRALDSFTRDRLLPFDAELVPSYDQVDEGFFSAALMRFRALAVILGRKEVSSWTSSHATELQAFTPITRFPTAHSAGLNFARSWGFWSLYQVTQDEVYRELYLQHVVTHLRRPEFWRDDYQRYSHWVPQFGVYAIALSFDEVPGRS
jgi:hypothetical protein